MNNAFCEECGIPFTRQRASAQFCSSKCRVKAHRHKAQVEQRLDHLESVVESNMKIVRGQNTVAAWERKDTRDRMMKVARMLIKELELYDRNLRKIELP